MNILSLEKSYQKASTSSKGYQKYRKTTKSPVIDLSKYKQKNRTTPIPENKFDPNLPKPSSLKKEEKDEAFEKKLEIIGKRIVFSFILFLCFLFCSFSFIVFYLSPKETEKYANQIKTPINQLDTNILKLESNIINNFKNDQLFSDSNLKEAASQQLTLSQELIEQTVKSKNNVCNIKPKYQILINKNLKKDIDDYCSLTTTFTNNYQKTLNYYNDLIPLQNQLWELFDSIPELKNNTPSEIALLANDYNEKAESFSTISTEINDLNNTYKLETIDIASINFSKGWANDLQKTANILDTVKIAQETYSKPLLDSANEEMQEVISNFDKRIINYKEERSIINNRINTSFTSNINTLNNLTNKIKIKLKNI